MIFSPELLPKVLDGSKTETRRIAVTGKPCRYRPGRTYAVQPGRGEDAVAYMRVDTVSLVPVRLISNGSAAEEGFDDASAFLRWWHDRHGTLDGSCWRIQFHLVRPAAAGDVDDDDGDEE